jgi:predicted nucleic acid-binding protein
VYLVDTNVWLERLLDQARSEEVGRFLDHTPSDQFFITDFAFHSIGVVMNRLKRMDALLGFTWDAFIDGAVSLVHLEPEDMQHIARVIDRFGLDFDDAYQYAAAEKYGLTIVSFDSDFDRTDLGRRIPAEVVQE